MGAQHAAPASSQLCIACLNGFPLCLASGMVRVMDNDDHIGPFNVGNPGAQLAGVV